MTHMHGTQGLKPLAVHTIEIVERVSNDSSDTPSLAQEEKLSSSDIRRGMLGSYRQSQVCVCVWGGGGGLSWNLFGRGIKKKGPGVLLLFFL